MRRRATTQGRPRLVPLPIESAAASWRHAPRQAFRTDPEQHGIAPVTILSADQTSLPIGTVCVSERPGVGHRCPPALYLPPSPIHALLRQRVHLSHQGISHPALEQGALGSSTSPGGFSMESRRGKSSNDETDGTYTKVAPTVRFFLLVEQGTKIGPPVEGKAAI